jgi:hypothetical protein
MRYGRKNLILVNGAGNRVGRRFRYKRLQMAVHSAINFSIARKTPIQVWDEDSGQEIALVARGAEGIAITVAKRNIFYQNWGG